jgi:hypothetical protein
MPTRLYARADGTLSRVTQAETVAPAPDPAAAASVLLDETAAGGEALLARLTANAAAFRLAADGTLTEDDTPVEYVPVAPPPPAVDPAAIGAALDALPEGQPLTKADLAPLLALFGAGVGPA